MSPIAFLAAFSAAFLWGHDTTLFTFILISSINFQSISDISVLSIPVFRLFLCALFSGLYQFGWFNSSILLCIPQVLDEWSDYCILEISQFFSWLPLQIPVCYLHQFCVYYTVCVAIVLSWLEARYSYGSSPFGVVAQFFCDAMICPNGVEDDTSVVGVWKLRLLFFS